ncbi:MAG: endonuclease III [Vicinamibacterales bacterium]
MKSPKEAVVIFDLLDEQHPGADTELHYTNAYELLTATILSAQSTDQGVNMVTPALFKRYPTPAALARATQEELEPQIHSTGFYRAKSKALIGMAQMLVEQHGGQVPADMDALTALPGVGRKTANVVLGHALGVPGLPVDRHVLRVSNRIGLAEGDDAVKVEAQLCALLPPERWTRASDCLILHGRRVCRPKPFCPTCLVADHCDYFRSGATTDVRAIESGRRAPARGTGAKKKSVAAGRSKTIDAPRTGTKGAARGPAKSRSRKRTR